jgi:hypothetical protein
LLSLNVARAAGEQTRDLLISFIFLFHHFTAEPQRLPYDPVLLEQEEDDCVHIVIRRESLAELQQLLKDDGENQNPTRYKQEA